MRQFFFRRFSFRAFSLPALSLHAPSRASLAVLLLLAAAAPLLSGCIGVAVGGAAAGGVAAAEERGIKNAGNDKGIQLLIDDQYVKHYQYLIRKVTVTVYEGRVLLTGVVGTEFSRDEATRLAWAASDRINEVINELQVDANDSLLDSASDTWISSQLRFKIATDEKIVDINYNIDTVNGIVYLIGLAQSEDELTRVTDYARTIKGVKKVISHVWLKTDPRRKPV
ncbi:BON domain-containing protein [Ferrovibrio xuzhouensis]|uniref:BON domain-containing protein n=1 Tax=Ferrovibrio xuzhouensis TaxID=1576914 RepID=A0ABV7VHV0_9PROT